MNDGIDTLRDNNDIAPVSYTHLEKSEKKLRKAINDEKALQHQLKQHTATSTEPVCPFLSGKLL